MDSLRGQRVLAIAGIGDPNAFFKQLESHANSLERRAYTDHHAYSDADAATLATCGAAFDVVVSTLKDAVKLGPRWPRQASELWYVSQRLDVEEGESELERMLARLLDLRHTYRP
ncbi:MAG: tetraacyldisaccharide 4'-kinase [Gemmatimonadaceae bacterium]